METLELQGWSVHVCYRSCSKIVPRNLTILWVLWSDMTTGHKYLVMPEFSWTWMRYQVIYRMRIKTKSIRDDLAVRWSNVEITWALENRICWIGHINTQNCYHTLDSSNIPQSDISNIIPPWLFLGLQFVTHIPGYPHQVNGSTHTIDPSGYILSKNIIVRRKTEKARLVHAGVKVQDLLLDGDVNVLFWRIRFRYFCYDITYRSFTKYKIENEKRWPPLHLGRGKLSWLLNSTVDLRTT